MGRVVDRREDGGANKGGAAPARAAASSLRHPAQRCGSGSDGAGLHDGRFLDTWERFLPPRPSGTCGTSGTSQAQSQANVPHVPDVASGRDGSKPSENDAFEAAEELSEPQLASVDGQIDIFEVLVEGSHTA